MPRKPRFKMSNRGSFVGIPTLIFRFNRGKREEQLADEYFQDGFLKGRPLYRSMYGNKPMFFRRKK